LPFKSKLFIVAIAFLLFGAIINLNVPAVSSAARPAIDTDSPVYSNLANEVLVSGYGLEPYFTYFLWAKKPGALETSYTGLSFVTTAAGGLPYPTVSIALDIPPLLGAYLLTVSTLSTQDTANAKCHFGVCGPVAPVYQRRETAKFIGGGIFPGSTVRIDVRNPLDALVSNATTIANERGEFAHSWSIPNNVQVGSWIVSVNGIGTMDNSFERHRSDGQFGVIEASLRFSVHQQPLQIYQRTETVKISFVVRYPDDSPVTTIKQGSKPIHVYRMGMRLSSLPLVLIDAANGIWTAQHAAPKNETLGKNFTFHVLPRSFDDGFGNKAPSSAFMSSQFEIVPAQLALVISSMKRTYEIVFDSVTLNATVKYPDGSDLIDGKVMATFESGSWSDTRSLLFHEESQSWILTYYIGISEVQHLGTWKMALLAEDVFGNSGKTSADIGVQVLWLFVVIVTLTILVVVILKWMSEETRLSRFIRRRTPRRRPDGNSLPTLS